MKMIRRARLLLLVSAIAIASPFAAAQSGLYYSAAKKLGPAKKWGTLGCNPGFFDTKGNCWRCPTDYRLADVLGDPASSKACKREAGRDNRKAAFVAKASGLIKTGCPKDAWLSTHDGGCYTCPSGFNHDIVKTANQAGVCWKDNKDLFAAATKVGTMVCPTGGFYDPIDGGTCWECPTSTPHRNEQPVTSNQACQQIVSQKKG